MTLTMKVVGNGWVVKAGIMVVSLVAETRI
jgi:hypothetical protein